MSSGLLEAKCAVRNQSLWADGHAVVEVQWCMLLSVWIGYDYD